METITCPDAVDAEPEARSEAGESSPWARHSASLFQPPLPSDYSQLTDDALDRRIADVRARLGKLVVVLGHHYQRDEVVKFADFRGDSFKLAQQAATRGEARYIVFCGVHFMAESADILSGPGQQVILPNLEAGCSMADMAHLGAVTDCWRVLAGLNGSPTVPVTYMNSTADLKAFCGVHGGAVCTSSNADSILRWAFERGERVLFFPDEHLGRNTARQLGLESSQIVVWNPADPLGGNDLTDLLGSRLILWKGFCSVHMRFSTRQIDVARQQYPGIKVIVHPECRSEVVLASDAVGSTEFIAKTIATAPSGSQWAVGTEIHLVSRLAKEHPDKLVFCLDPVVCPCATMYRIHPANLLWALDRLLAGEVVNRIVVPEETAYWARSALNRMLEVVECTITSS